MNTTPRTSSRADGIISAIGILVLVIGTATGNAVVMLAMAVVALALITLMYRQQAITRIPLLAMVTAALFAFALATVIASL